MQYFLECYGIRKDSLRTSSGALLAWSLVSGSHVPKQTVPHGFYTKYDVF